MPAALADNASVTTGFVQPASSATRKKVGRSVGRSFVISKIFRFICKLGPTNTERCRVDADIIHLTPHCASSIHPSAKFIHSIFVSTFSFCLSPKPHAHTHTQASAVASSKRLLSRGNDILTQSSTETLLEMLKSHANIKECSEETALHINGVNVQLDCYVDIL